MGIKKILAKPFSSYEVKKFLKANLNPLEAQMRVFENLISTAKDTNFGKDHHFEQIKNHTDFTNAVPVRDYEDLNGQVRQNILPKQVVPRLALNISQSLMFLSNSKLKLPAWPYNFISIKPKIRIG